MDPLRFGTARWSGFGRPSARGAGVSVPPPTGLAASAPTDATLHLAWDAVSGAASYALRRSPDHATWVVLSPGTATSYDDSGLAAGTTYYYQVSVTTAAGASPWSPAAPGTTTGSAFDYLLLEDGFRLLLEDGAFLAL
jgi:hypothetical protein